MESRQFCKVSLQSYSEWDEKLESFKQWRIFFNRIIIVPMFGDSSRNAGTQETAGDGGRWGKEVPFSSLSVWSLATQKWKTTPEWSCHNLGCSQTKFKGKLGSSGPHVWVWDPITRPDETRRRPLSMGGHSSFVLMCGSKDCRRRWNLRNNLEGYYSRMCLQIFFSYNANKVASIYSNTGDSVCCGHFWLL